MISLFGCTRSTLSTSQRLWNQTRTVAKEGNLPPKKWFMSSRLSNSWVNNVPWASSEACRLALASTGNKSPSIPWMKTGSQVSQSKHGDSAACRSDWNMTRFLLGCSSGSWGKDGNSHHDLMGMMLQLGWATATEPCTSRIQLLNVSPYSKYNLCTGQYVKPIGEGGGMPWPFWAR